MPAPWFTRARAADGRRSAGWFVAQVHGPSMAPTLRHGDAILVRRTARARPGDVVVARFATRPGALFVKRVDRAEGSGWWVLGDNEFATDDSRAYGVAEVVGRVVLRWWPRPALLRRRTQDNVK